MLMKILSRIRFLVRQGLALRGDGDESDGNFLQLLKLEGDKLTIDWMQKKNKYTYHDKQSSLNFHLDMMSSFVTLKLGVIYCPIIIHLA